MKKSLLWLLAPIFLLLAGCATQFGLTSGSDETPMVSNVYAIPKAGDDIVGQTHRLKVKKGMTFNSIARQYDIGARELMDANPGVSASRIRVGSTIAIPTEYILPPVKFRKGIVINIAEMRLYYFDKNNHTVMTFPVAVGRKGWSTPIASTYVYRKEEAPIWNVPKSIREAYEEKTGEEHPRRIGPGPDNPLGDYAIYLHMNGYLIHGTNNPASIGRRVSSGCIRMYNHDVAELYQYVRRGTPVNILYYPNKAGWRDGKLYLESHTPLKHKEGVYSANAATATQAVLAALKEQAGTVNWRKIQKVARRHNGLPTEIGVTNYG